MPAIRLLEIGNDNSLKIAPEALMIKEFKKIWDKYKDKGKALEELAYVYWMAYYNSVYDVYLTEEEKKQAIIHDVITTKGWKADGATEAAIEKFGQLQRTFSMAFLESAKAAAIKIRVFFETVDYNARNKSGGPVWKPKEIMSAISESLNVLNALEKWQERARKEEDLGDARIKGGGKVGIFEDETTAKWIET